MNPSKNRIAMVDPSNFTIPYDVSLCVELNAYVNHPVLYHCPGQNPEFTYRIQTQQWFYTLSSKMGDTNEGIKRVLQQIIKGLEHFPNSVALLKDLKKENFQLIHYQWFPLPILDCLVVKAAKRVGFKVVATVHDTQPFNGSPSSFLQKLGWTSAYRACDALVVHNNLSREALISSGLSADKIHVVPHGVDMQQTKKGYKQDVSSKGSLSILFFGTIKPYKGLDIFLQALGELPQDYLGNIRVTIAGKPYIPVEEIQQWAKDAKIQHIIKWDLRFLDDDEIHELYAFADMIVFPYRNIDFSGVVAQALIYGKAIIATNVGGFSELFTHGKDALLVPPDDSLAFSEALKKVIVDSELRQELGKGSADLAKGFSSWKNAAEQTAKIYHRLISEL